MRTELYCEEYGSGKPLVFLHGNGEDGSYFEPQKEYFSRRFRTLFPDTRGHGKSPRGSAKFSLDTFAQDLKNLLDGKNIRKATLIGFSDGGNIALIFALMYPEYVEKLVLCGANLYPDGIKVRDLREMQRDYNELVKIGKPTPEEKRAKELLSLMVNEPDIKPEELKRISCPALVLCGKRDVILRRHTRLIASKIPNAKLKILPGTHFTSSEYPEFFNETVRLFLEKE